VSVLFRDYEETFHSPGGRLISLLELEEVLNLLGHPSKKLILDVGTGTGRVARHLLKFNNDVVGVDISFDRLKLALKKAKKELKQKADDYYVVVADGHHIPFKDGTFDEVLSIRTLKYLKDPNRGFFEIARVLKQKGICVIELSNIFGYEALWLFLLKLFGMKNYYAQDMGSNYQLFDIFKVKKFLNSLNLIVVSKKGWHKIPTIFFIKCKSITILKILLCTEQVLQKFLPFFLFSRGMLIKFMNVRTH